MRFDRTLLLVLAVAVLGGLAGYWVGGRALSPPEIPPPPHVDPLTRGDPYVDLALPDLDGHSRRIAEFAAQGPLVINFWATWCPPCIREMPVLDAFAADADRHGVGVIGIALDDPDAVRRFLERTPVRYPILLDRSAADDSSVRYGNTRAVLPYTVLIGADGRIAEMRLGEVHREHLDAWAAAHGQR